MFFADRLVERVSKFSFWCCFHIYLQIRWRQTMRLEIKFHFILFGVFRKGRGDGLYSLLAYVHLTYSVFLLSCLEWTSGDKVLHIYFFLSTWVCYLQSSCYLLAGCSWHRMLLQEWRYGLKKNKIINIQR